MNLPGPTRNVPKHIEDELILGAELDEAKARIAELEEALRELAPLVGTMLDEEWFWQWTPDKAGWALREPGGHKCQGGDCLWHGADDHEPTCHVSKLRNAMRHTRKLLDGD